jgi:ribose transport system substrate-binding protein
MTHTLANRRGMLRATAGLAAASLLGNLSPALAAEISKMAGRSEKALKAAFSNIGLQVSWCAQRQTAGRILGQAV